MKRREFVLRTAGILGTLPIARTVFGQTPCPPSLSVEGGTTGAAPACGDGTQLSIGSLLQDAETPEQIALFIPITGSLGPEAYAITRYRVAGSGNWLSAHPLLRLGSGAPENGFAGSIFDLSPGTDYDVEVQVTDPGSGSQTVSGQFATRSLPSSPSTATTTAAPGSNLQSIINGLNPGDVLELQAGTHVLSQGLNVSVSGTANNPIYIRGASRTNTFLDATSGTAINVDGNHLVFENFTFTGGGANTQRVFVLSKDSNSVTNVTIRGIRSTNTGRAVQTAGGTSGSNAHNILVYNNEFIGVGPWNGSSISTNAYWNNDGLRLVGTGNCAWNNTLQGFGDTITFAHSVDDSQIKGCFAYRNLIRNSIDDCFEFDYSVRNCAAYDNYCENIRPLMSMDPIRGGPVYCFRNVAVNVATRPFKLNSSGSGYLIYNNTILRAETYSTGGSDTQAGFGVGWGKLNATFVNRIAYRNNVFIYRGGNSSKEIFRLRNLAARADGTIDWSHNAHFPDIEIVWEGDVGQDVFNTLADAQANIRPTDPLFSSATGLVSADRRHSSDVITASNPFTATIAMGPDAATEVTGQVVPVLSPGSTPKNSGITIPGITDGFSGGAPDMGAIIEGRTTPAWGANF